MSVEIAIASHLGKKVLSKLEDKFLGGVIKKWQNYRAQQFLDALAGAVVAGQTGPEAERKADEAIEDALRDEWKTEVLFDAWRRVVLSASKDLGPRMIAFLAAELIAAKRPATPGEEIVFRAAETLTDQELIGLRDYLPNPDEEQSHVTDSGGLRRVLRRENLRWDSRQWARATTGPLNLTAWFGPWAVKAVQLGLLTQEITEEAIKRPGAPFNREDQEQRDIEWAVVFIPETSALSKLITRAENSFRSRPTPQGPT